MHMVIQTGLIRKIPAGSDMINLLQKLQGIPHRLQIGVGTEVSILIPQAPIGSGGINPGEFLTQRHTDVRIGLSVLQHRVVPRLILLDQVTLQNQGLQLGVGHNILKSRNQADHLPNLGRLPAAALKVLPHPIL